MDKQRLKEITQRWRELRVVVAGDFCLDRYLHIDPALEEISLETDLPAHQVVRVRPQGGGAGNVLANVAALAPASLSAVGVAGRDGEGYELAEALAAMGAELDHFIRAKERMTFTYTKPLVMRDGGRLAELSRLDIRDRSPMPDELVAEIIEHLASATADADVVILMEQATQSACGVLSRAVKAAAAELAGEGKLFLADSRCDVGGFSGVNIKLNRDELRRHFDDQAAPAESLAARWAKGLGESVFVTMGADGILCADASGRIDQAPSVPVAGEIDIVGAGDTVLAHLAMALGAGASAAEAMALANLAANVVIRKLGTTGTAAPEELAEAIE